MTREKLLKTLKKYEILDSSTNSNEDLNDESTVQTLINDISRTDFSFSSASNDKAKTLIYKNIIYKTLSNFPIKYIQGMAEIATVLVDLYFGQKCNGVFTSVKNEGSDPKDFLNLSKENKESYEKFIQENKVTMTKLKNSLINIYNKKFTLFFKDNFMLYRECNDVFLEVMKNKGTEISRDVSFKYMNHVLTFFKRVYGNETVAYGIYNIILNSDVSVLFTLLTVFFENVHNSSSNILPDSNMIESIDEELLKKITSQHEIFLKTKEKINKSGKSSKYLFFGVAASAVAFGVALAFKMNRKD